MMEAQRLGGIHLQKRNIWVVLPLLLLVFLAAGCGQKERRITDGSEVYVKPQTAEAKEEPEEEEDQSFEEIYAVTAIDTDRRLLTLRDCENAVEVPYQYTGGTYIKDKYGKNLTVSQLSLGELVTIEVQDEKLSTVQVSKDAFSYDDLHNFTLDQDVQSLTVGSSIYYFDKSLLAYYGDTQIPLSELSDQDTVCIKGLGQQIYTLQVTTGHGVVTLENTELFLGGYITIGNVLSQKITPQMRIEVPEGTYLLSVANDGYGGSREITVEADREVKVNLDELKGDGPKLCSMQFELKPENAQIFLDGEQVETAQAIQVRYGVHRLTAKAEGYVDWERTLIVNSATSKIKIEMSTIEEAEEEETISTSNPSGNSTKNNSNNNNNSNNSNTGNNTNSNTGNNTNRNNNNNTNNNTNSNSTNNNRNNNNNTNRNNINNNSNNTNRNNNNNTNNNNNNSNNYNSNNNTNNNNNNNSNNNNSNNNTNNNNNNNTNNNNNSSNYNHNDNHEDHEDDETRRHTLMFIL